MLEEDLIVVKYGDPVLDFGVGTLPKLFSRFYPHLSCTYTHRGQTVVETLSDAEAWLIAQVLLLKSDQDFVLRLSNLPMAASLRSREDYLGKLRRMGLVFTTRLYYTRAEMAALFGPQHVPATPRQYAQQWDLSSLFHNLALIGRTYLDRQQTAVQRWQTEGAVSARPVVTLPADYRHEVDLPLVVARRIVEGAYDPRPLSSIDGADKRGPRWADLAAERVAQAVDAPAEIPPVRTNSPLAPAEKQPVRADFGRAPAEKRLVRGDAPAEKASVQAAHRLKNGRSSIVVDDVDVVDKSKEILSQAVFEHFARRKAVAYTPTGRDHKAVTTLIQAGYGLDQILAGIDAVFERGDDPQRFTYCASAIRDQSPARSPARLPASEEVPAVAADSRIRRAEASPVGAVTVPPDLQPAAEVFRLAQRELTPDMLARLKLLAEKCESAARTQSMSGTDWLTEALQIGLGRADDLLAYAEAILDNWLEHGYRVDPRPTRAAYAPTRRAPKTTPASGSAPPKPAGRQRRDFDAEVLGSGAGQP